MATTITHGFVAAAMGRVFFPEKMPARFWVLALVCSVLPDLDIIGFRFGISYRHVLGHRGFMHSLLFAVIVGVLVAVFAFPAVQRFSRRWWALAGFFSLVTAMHGLLDAMTNGGYGTGFFIPFDNTRYFLPWKPLQVSPIGIRDFLSARGSRILLNEFLWVWLPGLFLLLIASWYRFRTQRSPQAPAAKP